MQTRFLLQSINRSSAFLPQRFSFYCTLSGSKKTKPAMKPTMQHYLPKREIYGPPEFIWSLAGLATLHRAVHFFNPDYDEYRSGDHQWPYFIILASAIHFTAYTMDPDRKYSEDVNLLVNSINNAQLSSQEDLLKFFKRRLDDHNSSFDLYVLSEAAEKTQTYQTLIKAIYEKGANQHEEVLKALQIHGRIEQRNYFVTQWNTMKPTLAAEKSATEASSPRPG